MNTTTETKSRPTFFFLCIVIALCVLHQPARAAEEELRTQTVSFADLDISTQAGAKVLYQRIVAAAYRVCGATGFDQTGALKRQFDCVGRSINDAVKRVGSPTLSAQRSPSVIRLASK